MDSSHHSCKVCGQLTSLFNYGTYSCSACSSFFRRTLLIKSPLQPCQNCEICFKDWNRAVHSDCKYCRFHQCVSTGMLNTQKYMNLPKLMNELSLLDKGRKNALTNMAIPHCFDLNSIFSHDFITFTTKPKELKYTPHDWGCMHQLTSMEFMKSFQFVKFLSVQDLKLFLKSAHFNHVLFASAMRSFGLKQAVMSFPDRVDVFPESIGNVSCYNPQFLNRIRCRLMGKVIELNITPSEFLLLSAIIFCNAGCADLSENGRMLINSYQKIYGSFLFQHCTQTHQQNGPLRFSELLSICQAISETHEDVKKFFILFQMYQPESQPKQLYQDVIEFLSM